MCNVRVIKIVCPSCKGTGQFSILPGLACMWCNGEKRVLNAVGHRYADHIHMLAGGGFVLGDHSYDHMIEMETEAEAIYALTGTKVPWPARTRAAGFVPRF